LEIDQFDWMVVLAVSSALLLLSVVVAVVAWRQKHNLWRSSLTDIDRLGSEIVVLGAKSAEVQREIESRLADRDREVVRLCTLIEQKDQLLAANRASLTELTTIKEGHIELQARLAEREEQLQSKEQLLVESKKMLLKEFELTANRLFDAKQQSFNQTSRQNLETVLSPFKQQLQTFHKQVEDVYHKENTQRNQLVGQICELQKQAKKISEDANNLATALKGDNKVQGQWGEIILERLLEQSGLEKGREYHTQYNFKQEGKNYRPDVVIHLPDDKDIIVDSKVALVEYERFVNEDLPERKDERLRAHIESLRTHIKALSLKSYENLEGLRTLDFVFLFVPIEAAYIAAVQHSPSLFKEAHDKNIMLVSPSSLMVALRTVETMWRYEKQNANAEKIASSAGKLYDQFTLVMSALEDVGSHINKAGESYEVVFNRLSQGRGNVLKRIDDLKKLGAKTSKQLPKATQERLDADRRQIELMPDGES